MSNFIHLHILCLGVIRAAEVAEEENLISNKFFKMKYHFARKDSITNGRFR
jgi:hypothetical protein